MSSAGGHSYGYNADSYDPQQYSMRHTAGRDGYAINPDPPAYSHQESPRRHRRSSVGAADDYQRRDDWGTPGKERGDTSRALGRRGRNDRYDEYSDEEDEYYQHHRGRSRRDADKSLSKDKKSRSLSRFKERISGYFGPDEHADGDENTVGKKWGATIAGAVAGGAIGKTAKKDTWFPAAIGAFLGGFAAREAEKTYYRRREIENNRGKSGSKIVDRYE